MRFALLVLVFIGSFVGCGAPPPRVKPTVEQQRAEYYGTAREVEVNDYLVVDDGEMVIFSSAPVRGGSGMKYEREFLKEYKNVMAAVSRWKLQNPDEKVSIAVSERGGHYETHPDNAYYTVRVVLLRE